MAHTLTLQVPEEVYSRLELSARATQKPVEDLVVQSLKAGLPPSVADLPPEEQAEYLRMERLADDELFKIAFAKLPSSKQRRLSALLRKNQAGSLGAHEEQELHQLNVEARRITERKAHSYALLRWRGLPIPAPSDLYQG